MTTTVRTWNNRGELVGYRVVSHGLETGSLRVRSVFESQEHPVLSSSNLFEESYRRYVFQQEQLALNESRTGVNLVDPERTRHILEGSPILRTPKAKFGREGETTATVRGWSGGHANPNAAQYGKTQIPDYWTGDRFMYEVSDILVDDSSRWYLQVSEKDEKEEEAPERYVCVEERYGVPIRVVAERVGGEMKCVTAFPDYTQIALDENLRVFSQTEEEKTSVN